MSDRPKANLVRTIEYGKSTTYIFSCVDCGKEFVRSANNRRINPYCGDCQRKYDKIKNADNKAKRQAEHDKQIRSDAIEECIQSIKDNWHFWNIGVIAEVIKKLEQLKEQTDADPEN